MDGLRVRAIEGLRQPGAESTVHVADIMPKNLPTRGQ